MKKYKTVLSIAGSDSSGGAGVQADIKSISANGCYAATVITALTAQNTVGVRAIHIPELEVFAAQLEAVLDDIAFDAVKIGMLPSAEYALELEAKIKKYKLKNIVLDPVMVATSNDRLVDDSAAKAIIDKLLPLSALVTPNIPEAEFISGIKISSLDDFSSVAARFHSLGAENVLIKGGHGSESEITDRLFSSSGGQLSFTYPFIDTVNTHGTGCSLSSAIASYLAHGHALEDAVKLADDYLHKALKAGADYSLGSGHGAINHFLF